MKKTLLLLLATFAIYSVEAQQNYEYKIVTAVESLVPMGMGRSRIVEEKDSKDAKNFTTERTGEKDSKQKDKKRGEAKANKFSETKLLNFYSGVGINFQNIASNDALISSKVNNLVAEGWELTFVTSGVESAGYKDKNGIFITRFVFKRAR